MVVVWRSIRFSSWSPVAYADRMVRGAAYVHRSFQGILFAGLLQPGGGGIRHRCGRLHGLPGLRFSDTALAWRFEVRNVDGHGRAEKQRLVGRPDLLGPGRDAGIQEQGQEGADDEREDMIRTLGVDKVINKPLPEFADLKAMIDAVIRRRNNG